MRAEKEQRGQESTAVAEGRDSCADSPRPCAHTASTAKSEMDSSGRRREGGNDRERTKEGGRSRERPREVERLKASAPQREGERGQERGGGPEMESAREEGERDRSARGREEEEKRWRECARKRWRKRALTQSRSPARQETAHPNLLLRKAKRQPERRQKQEEAKVERTEEEAQTVSPNLLHPHPFAHALLYPHPICVSKNHCIEDGQGEKRKGHHDVLRRKRKGLR